MEKKGSLHLLLDESFASFYAVLEKERNVPSLREVGVVRSITGSIAVVEGLPGAKSDELLLFADDVPGMVFDLDRDSLGAVILGKSDRIRSGSKVRRTGRVQDVPVGEELLGRVIDPTGKALDERGPIRSYLRRSVEREAPPIMDRAPVTVPLQTGIKVVDSLIPIGRGQRELILGDRQTGKTTLALDVILNQRDQNVLCIYCAIGQRSSSVARVVSELREKDCMGYTIVVAAGSDDSPALQFITPYAATTIGEYFMERGRDVLVVYDDLTRHARAYRELSLLLRRPPGREAYPGDIFYIHSRLLERSAHLKGEKGGGSLTALPVVETQAQDLAAYIPTNLISITDGQIYLSPDLFQKGVLPPVDVERSVSRVGGKTQLPAYRAVTGNLKLSYSQFHELEAFARFGTRLDSGTKRILDRGQRVREIFKQPPSSPLPVEEQILVLLAVTEGVLDAPEIHLMEEAEHLIRSEMRLELGSSIVMSDLKRLRDAILSGAALDAEGRAMLLEIARRSVEKLLSRREAQKKPGRDPGIADS